MFVSSQAKETLVGGLEHFSIYWECHHPNWRSHIFQRGRSTTNQYISGWYLLMLSHQETSWNHTWIIRDTVEVCSRSRLFGPCLRFRQLRGDDRRVWDPKGAGGESMLNPALDGEIPHISMVFIMDGLIWWFIQISWCIMCIYIYIYIYIYVMFIYFPYQFSNTILVMADKPRHGV